MASEYIFKSEQLSVRAVENGIEFVFTAPNAAPVSVILSEEAARELANAIAHYLATK